MKVTKDIAIEDLVEEVPKSVKYLMYKGIKCIACGEPIWGTLEDAAKEKGFTDEDIKKIVNELQEFSDNPGMKVKEPQSKVDVKNINQNKNNE